MFSLVFSTLFRYIKSRVNTDKNNGEISPTISPFKTYSTLDASVLLYKKLLV